MRHRQVCQRSYTPSVTASEQSLPERATRHVQQQNAKASFIVHLILQQMRATKLNFLVLQTF